MNRYLDIAPEVQQALTEGRPVVALESTIISHGMPYPQNVETALNVEKIIRENGAVPATIAVIKGRLKAGLSPEEIDYLGKTGTAVAKEAADIILLDDSFPSIVQAVLWGRSLYRNLQKFLIFQLTVNFVALAIAILGPFLNLELPLTIIQVLWINLIMDTFAAIALATDPPDPALMELPPRRQGEFMLSKAMLRQILATGIPCLLLLVAILLLFQARGMEIPDEWAETTPLSRRMLTQFFSLFVLLQFWNLFATKCWGTRGPVLKHLLDNRPFLLISGIILLGQILIVTFGGRVFRTVPLSVTEWLEVAGFSALLLPFHLLLGWWQRLSPRPPARQ